MRTVFIALLVASAAHAFELKKDRDGDVVKWISVVRFVVDEKLDERLQAPGAVEAAKAAVKTWGLAMPNAQIEMVSGDVSGPGSTISVIDHDWPYDDKVFAVTITKVDYVNNAIVEADIYINAAQNQFAVLPADSRRGGAKADVQNTLTHELGHALGLQHEGDVTDAVMFPIAYDGDVDKRHLSGDDMAGLDVLYPLAPVESPELQALGCSVGGGAAAPFALGLGLLAMASGRRARVVARRRA